MVKPRATFDFKAELLGYNQSHIDRIINRGRDKRGVTTQQNENKTHIISYKDISWDGPLIAGIRIYLEDSSSCGLDRIPPIMFENLFGSFFKDGPYVDKKWLWFSRLKTMTSNIGAGTFLMNDLCGILDDNDLYVLNCLNPYEGRSGLPRLTRFYGKFGFEEIKPGLMYSLSARRHF